MDPNNILEYVLLGMGGFTLTSVIALKTQVAAILEAIKNADEKSVEYRSRTTQEIREMKLEIKELWKSNSL